MDHTHERKREEEPELNADHLGGQSVPGDERSVEWESVFNDEKDEEVGDYPSGQRNVGASLPQEPDNPGGSWSGWWLLSDHVVSRAF